MKKLLPFIILLSFAATGFSWPFQKPKPSPTPKVTKVVTPVETPTISGGRNILKDLQAALKEALEANNKLSGLLKQTREEVETAKAETLIVQKKADDLLKWGLIQQAEKEKYMKKYDEALKKYHRLKLLAAIIGGAVGILIGFQFMNLAPPPYSFAVPFGAAALFAALVWIYF